MTLHFTAYLQTTNISSGTSTIDEREGEKACLTERELAGSNVQCPHAPEE